MTWPPPAPVVAVVAVVVAASACDLRTRRIPNALTIGAAAVAVVLHGVLSGWSGVSWAVAGWAVGLVLFFPLFALGGMGAGDVKLLAAIGAWLGPMGAVWTALYGAIAGGIMALVVTFARGYTFKALGNLGAILRSWLVTGIHPVEGQTLDSSPSPRLPYALALAAGTLVTLWMQ
jgi:prepilin peptidase CpaA